MILKRLSGLRGKHWFVICVVLPTFFAAIYFGIVASDQFISQSRFVVKSVNQRQAQMSTLANLVQTTGLSGGQEQANQVIEYIRSRDALRDLEPRIQVRELYSSRNADFLSRFPAPWREDRFENLYRYYGGMVDAHLDPETGTAVLTVKAFSAKDAQKINAGLLELSENLVNQLNERSEKRAIAEAQARVASAEVRVRAARVAMREYRNTQDVLDPVKQGQGVLEISSRLITEQAGLKSQLELMERVTPANPSIPALRNRIAALGNEIAAQNGRAVGTKGGLASKLGNYENLALEEEFASQNLTVANAALEQARSDSAKQKFYLERIVEPNAPDLSLYPNRLRSIAVFLMAAMCLFLVAWMLSVGIIEHAPED